MTSPDVSLWHLVAVQVAPSFLLIWLVLAVFIAVQATGGGFPGRASRRHFQQAFPVRVVLRRHRKSLCEPLDDIAPVFRWNLSDEMLPRCREIQISTGHRHREWVRREIGGIALKEIIDIRSPTQKDAS